MTEDFPARTPYSVVDRKRPAFMPCAMILAQSSLFPFSLHAPLQRSPAGPGRMTEGTSFWHNKVGAEPQKAGNQCAIIFGTKYEKVVVLRAIL